MHGWGSDSEVWEQLPALTCAANPRLVALSPDLNGFGESPFLAEVPAVEQCAPNAVMRLVMHLVEMLGLRSGARAKQRRRVVTFVGHSMSGAALFYLQDRGWHQNEFARCALAPTLLIDEQVRKHFFLKLGIEASTNKPLDDFKSRLGLRLIERMIGSVGARTRADHLRIFESTPKGTLVRTLYGMGMALRQLKKRHWCNFRVTLAHDDRLLDVTQMLNQLDDLGLGPDQIRVVGGDHFLFSASDERRQLHLRNREIILGEILHLHEVCREGQRVQRVNVPPPSAQGPG
jgi:pimeloyl-ACP methyl ester carboxylesterase